LDGQHKSRKAGENLRSPYTYDIKYLLRYDM